MKITKWTLIYRLLKVLGKIETHLSYIAQAQCRIASLPHPSVSPKPLDEPVVLRTDRALIGTIREEETERYLYGIKEENPYRG